VGVERAEDTAALLAVAARKRHGIALSPRQAEVALLILRGHSSLSIGLRLGLSPQTIKVFRKQLYRRCAITSQAELFALMLPLLNDGG
jgi:DNA-binding CsgD family transcriptional regulator